MIFLLVGEKTEDQYIFHAFTDNRTVSRAWHGSVFETVKGEFIYESDRYCQKN